MGRHSRFLNMAAVAAEQSPLETKHGSLLVRGGKIIGSGCNSDRSRVQNVPGDSNIISLHSEVRGRAAREPVGKFPPCPPLTGLHLSLAQVAAAKAVPWLLQGSWDLSIQR